MKILKINILIMLMLLCAGGVSAQNTQKKEPVRIEENGRVFNSQQEYEEYLTTLEVDTTIRNVKPQVFYIRGVARPKGNKGVILRWSPEEYASWVYINQWGYNILRREITDDDALAEPEVLKQDVKPLTLDEMKKRFEPSDSLAGAAAQLLYGKVPHLAEPTQMGYQGIIERYDEQQTKFAYGMLLSEIRPDIAEAMALRYVDRTAKEGRRYEYIITSSVPDSIMHTGIVPITVLNNNEEPAAFTPEVTDSINKDGRSISIFWPMSSDYSTYDIERSADDGKTWTKLNRHPFITLISFENEGVARNHYLDTDLEPGVYQYRIKGYDTFGDASAYCDAHEVVLPDLVPPGAPIIKQMIVDRATEGKVFVDIHWHKEYMEEDMMGYNVYYFNANDKDVSVSNDLANGANASAGVTVPEASASTIMQHGWQRMNSDVIAANDSVFRCEVNDIASGFFIVSAVDNAGNLGSSIPQELLLTDYTPPTAPTGLAYTISPTGVVVITWEPNPEKDIKSYQLYSANDSTHVFTPMAGKLSAETFAIDTLETYGVNQKYIYYRVQAYDFAGNASELSDMLQVKRVNYTKPEMVRADSIWAEDQRIYTRWIASHNQDVELFRVYRQRSNNDERILVMDVLADSVRDEKFVVYDDVEYDDKNRYYYVAEAINATGISSGMSYRTSYLLQAPGIMEIPITLTGGYDQQQGYMHLEWKIAPKNGTLPAEYNVILQRANSKDVFVDQVFGQPTDTKYRNRMGKGRTEKWRIQLMLPGGVRSTPSNVVTIVSPK